MINRNYNKDLLRSNTCSRFSSKFPLNNNINHDMIHKNLNYCEKKLNVILFGHIEFYSSKKKLSEQLS